LRHASDAVDARVAHELRPHVVMRRLGPARRKRGSPHQMIDAWISGMVLASIP